MDFDRNQFMEYVGKFRREPVKLDGFAGAFAREQSATESQTLANKLEAAKSEKEEVHAMAEAVVKVLCDKNGGPVLTEADLPVICSWPARILRCITEASGKAGGTVKDSEKNG